MVLKILAKQELSGYALIKQIEKETGFWKPSSGSLFPLLKKLEKEGYIRLSKEKKRNLYSVTPEGRQHLKLIIQKKNNLINYMLENLKVYQTIASDKNDANFLTTIVHKLKKGDMPFRELQPEISMLRGTIFHLYSSSRIYGNEKKIRMILRKTIDNLKKLEKTRK